MKLDAGSGCFRSKRSHDCRTSEAPPLSAVRDKAHERGLKAKRKLQINPNTTKTHFAKQER
jgi:hypothetical protein